MKQSKKDIQRNGRAYCTNCGLLSNEPSQICDNGLMPKTVRINHQWYYSPDNNLLPKE